MAYIVDDTRDIGVGLPSEPSKFPIILGVLAALGLLGVLATRKEK